MTECQDRTAPVTGSVRTLQNFSCNMTPPVHLYMHCSVVTPGHLLNIDIETVIIYKQMSPPEVVTFARKTSKPYHTSHIIVTLCHITIMSHSKVCIPSSCLSRTIILNNSSLDFGLIELTILLPLTYPYTFHLIAFIV